MIEKLYEFSVTDTKTIERVIDDENVNINHIVLDKGGSLPVHNANSNVYLVVVRGTLFVNLAEQDTHAYSAGSIVNVPYGTKMYIRNEDDALLEFFVFKSPNPRFFSEK